MKNKKILLIVLIFAAFCIIGCFSSPRTVPVPYSFAGEDSVNGTAKIIFTGYGEKVGVRFVDYDGIVIPAPPTGTRWEYDAFIFPAGEPLNLRVYVYWKKDEFGERRRGIFLCPPLEAEKEYKLWFRGSYRKGGSLTLTYANVASLNSKTEKIYEQIIPPLE
jgi:hypothetical protein